MPMEIFYYGIKFNSFRICFSLPAKDMYILIQNVSNSVSIVTAGMKNDINYYCHN